MRGAADQMRGRRAGSRNAIRIKRGGELSIGDCDSPGSLLGHIHSLRAIMANGYESQLNWPERLKLRARYKERNGSDPLFGGLHYIATQRGRIQPTRIDVEHIPNQIRLREQKAPMEIHRCIAPFPENITSRGLMRACRDACQSHRDRDYRDFYLLTVAAPRDSDCVLSISDVFAWAYNASSIQVKVFSAPDKGGLKLDYICPLAHGGHMYCLQR